ncbi:hypothetical protein OEZ86_009652 [Tetradesmus obliquus]|uniref:RRM domain-containing protein n=2 Tax=Tetradesmus obliquus TaxID=3088 RepID=A0ABY8UQN4_TETOB|nr:hypothetical protein OEZ85_001096 [Tetradesmus obliquus]WIA43137.1 hypothetical protein OEZ86_009652 [Tetradesmus obliquus]
MAEEEQQFHEDEQYEEDGMEADGAGEEGHEDAVDELEAMKQKLKELEEEAAKLRSTQQGGAAEEAEEEPAGEGGNKEEADSRSVFVNNVDWGATPEELQQHFATCGTVNRVTILTDKFGNPKGFAYIEFLEADAVDNAIMLDNSELRGRQIKVMRKRTNVPGLKRGRGRGRGRFGPPRGRGGYHGGYGYGYGGGYGYGYGGYGYAPRGRGRGRGYAPY